MIIVQNYIAGSFETEIETIDDIGPATGEKIAKIPRTIDANASIADSRPRSSASRHVMPGRYSAPTPSTDGGSAFSTQQYHPSSCRFPVKSGATIGHADEVAGLSV